MTSLWKWQKLSRDKQPCDETPNTTGHGGSVNQSHGSVLPHSPCRAPPRVSLQTPGQGPREAAPSVKVRVHVTKRVDYLDP